MAINHLCKKYAITGEQWKASTDKLIRHIFLDDLFPKCDGTDSDIVAQVLRSQDLNNRDKYGEIYATVRLPTMQLFKNS